MKNAKRIILCSLAMIMLVSFYCVNTCAYGLGSYIEETSNGNDLFNLYVWNDNNQAINYTLHAELTKYSGADYTFGACYASIVGKNRTTYRIEEYDGDDQEAYYAATNVLDEQFAAYFQNGSYCTDSVTASKSNFLALYGEGTAIVGYLDSNSEYQFRLTDTDGLGGTIRIPFTPEITRTKSFEWVPVEEDDDGFIQMSN